MVWKTLGDALENALASRLNEVGEEAIAVAPDAVKLPKGARTIEGPGQVTELHQKEEKPDGASRERTNPALPMGRRMTVATASPKAEGSPTRAAVIRLVIDNGGGPAPGGGKSRAAYRTDPVRVRAREWLRLVCG